MEKKYLSLYAFAVGGWIVGVLTLDPVSIAFAAGLTASSVYNHVVN